MEVCTVSCHGGQLKACHTAGAHTHPVNPLVSVLSSQTIHPFTRLYLCFSDEDKGKHSIIPPHPPPPQSLQARLMGLISNCDLTAWWKEWHTCTNAHTITYTHTNVYANTKMWQRG